MTATLGQCADRGTPPRPPMWNSQGAHSNLAAGVQEPRTPWETAWSNDVPTDGGPRWPPHPDSMTWVVYDLETLLAHRQVLGLFAGAGLAAPWSGAPPTTGASSASESATSSSSPASALVSPTSSATSGTSNEEIPEETSGPYPGDGSNGPNVLHPVRHRPAGHHQVLRIRLGVASGVPLTVELTITGTPPAPRCRARPSTCGTATRRAGTRSTPTASPNENYLRGVQAADANGKVTFTTIFPAAYMGRWPHIHFEVYASLNEATAAGQISATSQLALPEDASATPCTPPTGTTAARRTCPDLAGVRQRVRRRRRRPAAAVTVHRGQPGPPPSPSASDVRGRGGDGYPGVPDSSVGSMPEPRDPRAPPSPPVPPPPGTWVLGRIRGIRLTMQVTWLPVAMLLAIGFSALIGRQFPFLGSWRYMAAFAFVVAFTLSILVHELAHALVAQRFDIGARDQPRLLRGRYTSRGSEVSVRGVRRLGGRPARLAGGRRSGLAGTRGIGDGVAYVALWELAVANLIVGVTNLLPGLPLDGGWVLRRWSGSSPATCTPAPSWPAWAGRILAIACSPRRSCWSRSGTASRASSTS